jgi:CorA-like Mg2+ transporter protein
MARTPLTRTPLARTLPLRAVTAGRRPLERARPGPAPRRHDRLSVAENEDMRKISAWVAIAAVPTMIAGIEGMNFAQMPELQTTWGYPVVLGTMATICGILYRGFKRKGWL